MITTLFVDGIQFSDKRNKTLLKKLVSAAVDGATEEELVDLLNNVKTSKTKLPLDLARILQMLKGKSEEIIVLMEKLANESAILNTVGSAMSDVIKEAIKEQETLEDDQTLLTWKQTRKLVIMDKTKPEAKPAKKSKKGTK